MRDLFDLMCHAISERLGQTGCVLLGLFGASCLALPQDDLVAALQDVVPDARFVVSTARNMLDDQAFESNGRPACGRRISHSPTCCSGMQTHSLARCSHSNC